MKKRPNTPSNTCYGLYVNIYTLEMLEFNKHQRNNNYTIYYNNDFVFDCSLEFAQNVLKNFVYVGDI